MIFDERGLLIGQEWIHLGNIWRASLDGWGIDPFGYCYDLIYDHSHSNITARVSENKTQKIIEQVNLGRKETAIKWLTRKYKEFNEY